MRREVSVCSLPPDLRFGAIRSLARPGQPVDLGSMTVQSYGCLPHGDAVPAYLHYGDREATIVLPEDRQRDDLERALTAAIHGRGALPVLDEASAAVMTLAAVDGAFRATGLWPGNIYLAGSGALGALLRIVGLPEQNLGLSERVVRELQALELVYLFPIAPKFRNGVYDGQVQYRLNGWGRSLAQRLRDSDDGQQRGQVLRQRITAHLIQERERYAGFLDDLDLARQQYGDDRFGCTLTLPIPVLV